MARQDGGSPPHVHYWQQNLHGRENTLKDWRERKIDTLGFQGCISNGVLGLGCFFFFSFFFLLSLKWLYPFEAYCFFRRALSASYGGQDSTLCLTIKILYFMGLYMVFDVMVGWVCIEAARFQVGRTRHVNIAQMMKDQNMSIPHSGQSTL